MDKVICFNNKFNTLAVIMLLSILMSSVIVFSLSVFMMQLFLALITIPLIVKKNYQFSKLYFVIFIVSIIFVFLVYMANLLNYGSPYYIGGSDDINFEKWAFIVYNANMYNPAKILDAGIIGKYNNSPFFVVYISLLVRFSKIFDGYSTFLPRLANVYFLIWICMILEYLLTKYTSLSNEKILYSIAIFALFPNTQYINAHVFRDTFNLLQILLIILLFDFLLSKKRYLLKFISILLLPLLLYCTYYTRKNSLLFAAVIIIFMFSELYKVNKLYLVSLIILSLMSSTILDLFRIRYYIEKYSDYMLYIAGDGLSKYVFNRPLFPLGIFYRSIYAFINPFPNFFLLFKTESKLLLDFVRLLIYIGVVIQICFIPFIFKRILKFDWLSLSFSSWFLAVITATFTFRHFLLFYPFMSAVAVDGFLSTKLEKRKIILFCSVIIVINFGMIYLILKLFL